jgi:hypothetical protein
MQALASTRMHTNRFKDDLRLRLMKTLHRLAWSFQRLAMQRESSAALELALRLLDPSLA